MVNKAGTTMSVGELKTSSPQEPLSIKVVYMDQLVAPAPSGGNKCWHRCRPWF
jgi:hypothetical protein